MHDIFEKGYLCSVIEHEMKHLQPIITYQHDLIPAPRSILLEQGPAAYMEVVKMLTSRFEDFLIDIYANSAMSNNGLKKYLEFEGAKLKRLYSKKEGCMITPLMLISSYIEVCYENIGVSVPMEIVSILNSLQEDETNKAIYEKMKTVYRTMWISVKQGQQEVDLKQLTYDLNELLKCQKNSWF